LLLFGASQRPGLHERRRGLQIHLRLVPHVLQRTMLWWPFAVQNLAAEINPAGPVRVPVEH
jgi:hypothetical protein